MRRLLLLLPTAFACGPNALDDVFPLDSGPIVFDATVDHASFFDASQEAEAGVVFNGGGPFTCGGCVCDGTLNLCFPGMSGGGAPIVDAGADAQDAGSSDADADVDAETACATDASVGCVQIPIDCLPKPTCTCIASHFVPCTCAVDPTGNGIVLTCPPAP